jgi:hypothetical protein
MTRLKLGGTQTSIGRATPQLHFYEPALALGLPDGLFSNQTLQFWHALEGLG